MIHTMKTIKLLILLLSFAVGLSSLTSCSDDGPEPTPIAEAPVFAMNENFEITAKCANPYKAYVNGIETILPYTITQTYKQQTIVVSGYGYGVNLQNSDTVEQTFVVPALVDNHEYVDLGLPSGTLWATCNVGASSPEEYGDYFAWGETEPKDNYDWNTYKWYNHDIRDYTKYHLDYAYYDESGNYHSVPADGNTVLDPEDDAAYVNWSPLWRMPTGEQQRELVEKCTWTWTTSNGVIGQLVTGPNGNTIFLPAAGHRTVDSLDDAGSGGFYWSRTIVEDWYHRAYTLYLNSGGVSCSSGILRIDGGSVRAVRMPEENHEYVDLGLPSGTLWATCNIGADAPEEYGHYFAWGETERKETFTWENYKWCEGSFDTMTKYCTDSGYGSNGFTDGKMELDPEDDAAYVNWGPSWRMPTHEQQRELVEQCTWIGETRNGLKGQLITGPNGYTIFLPASRSSVPESPYNTGTWGTWAFYWSRTLRTNQSDNASDLLYPAYPANATWDHYNDRYIGEAVRPVCLP